MNTFSRSDYTYAIDRLIAHPLISVGSKYLRIKNQVKKTNNLNWTILGFVSENSINFF